MSTIKMLIRPQLSSFSEILCENGTKNYSFYMWQQYHK